MGKEMCADQVCVTEVQQRLSNPGKANDVIDRRLAVDSEVARDSIQLPLLSIINL